LYEWFSSMMSMMWGAAGAVVTVKELDDVTGAPPGAVTEIGPLVAPVGTVALMCASSVTENVVAAVALNFTTVAPEKPVPLIVTTELTGPLGGLNPLIVGGGGLERNVKDVGENPVVAPTVTPIRPLEAPDGTVALMFPSFLTVNVVAAFPLNFTAVAPVNPLPTIEMIVPTAPLEGLNEVIVGADDPASLNAAITPVHFSPVGARVAE
jgi:hypothetical protein